MEPSASWASSIAPDDDLRDPAARMRARIVVLLPLALAVWAPPFATINVVLGRPVAAVAIALIGVALLTGPLIHRLNGSVRLSAHILVGGTLAGLACVSHLTGGLLGEAAAWLVVVPLLAVFMLGMRQALLWTLLTVTYAALALLPQVQALQGPPDSPMWLRSVALAALILATASLAFVYHRTSQTFRRRLHTRTAELEQALLELEDARMQIVEEQALLAQAESQLRISQKMEAVGQLASGVAHEINTPIQFIGDTVGFLGEASSDYRKLIDDYRQVVSEAQPDLLARLDELDERRDRAWLDAEMQPAVDRVQDGVQRVARIVRAMRDLAHPSTGELVEASVEDALESTLVVARNVTKTVADVHVQLAGLPEIPCYADELGQVFLNLVVNAVHAIEDKQEQTGVHAMGRICVRTWQDRDWAVVEIEDDGAGIPPEIVDRVFEPFFTTKPQGEGTGQGLAIAHAVVEKHGGRLQVHSQVGVGTTFQIRLPTQRMAA